jgi:DivIVA domain-containing protein
MATALIYVLVLLAVAALVFVGASALFGRGEELAPIPKGSSPTWLPDGAVAAADVRAVRFQQAVRGYRMAEVDWVLDRVAGELERLSEEHGRLQRRLAELEHAQPDEPGHRDEPGPPDPGEPGPPDPDEPADPPPAVEPSSASRPPTQEHTEA